MDELKAKQFTDRDHWALSLTEEIHRSGFVERLYKK